MADYHKFVDTPEKLKRRVDATTRAITEHFPTCKTLIVCGHSSMAVSAPVAYLLGLGLAVIRKEGEVSNDPSDSWPAGVVGDCVFVDDFICSGRTTQRIWDRVSPHKLIGIIYYEYMPGFNHGKLSTLHEFPTERLAQGVWRVL